ncbi:MAG: asparagine synthase (glutamine-hydrolyzing) [Burkholderiales bacterium PBB4]|nr:MAG: asparagine synthase (glutamine-hydrolyzing) [Burkholderiales bacterium PBB4]
MCGIAGLWLSKANSSIAATASSMVAAIHHRGPDSNAVWALDSHGLALAHARLAIVDLSPAGAQPMHSASQRYTVVFNGEIYNHRALRRELEDAGRAPPWHGHSDTETLLAAIEAWGITRAIEACTGMFAIALWDRMDGSLTLIRDRFGEKPLYWAQTAMGLVFGSEMKSLVASGLVDRRLSRDAALAMLRHNNIPSPLTVYEGVQKLMPGSSLRFAAPDRADPPTVYWSPQAAWAQAHQSPFTGDDATAAPELEQRLSAVIGDQMVADVPLGAFLSGGIDSSTVVALMQRQATRPVRTFSIGFEEEGFNEAEAAKAVAQHLGTVHTELYVTPRDALAVVPRLPTMFCEPFADSSQIPTHLVAAMARQHVTVALSGDAGDEVFGGYNRYLLGPGLLRRMARYPLGLRRCAAALMGVLSPQQWDRVVAAGSRLLPAQMRFNDAGDKLDKMARAMTCRDDAELYQSFISQWPDPQKMVPGASESLQPPDWSALGLGHLGVMERMMVRDALGYLQNDILVKVDRAAMSVSLEGRIPFLDHRLYEFAARLPAHMKVRNGTTKWLLRQVLYRHVPQALIDRPKVGFGIPLAAWLRGALRDWADDLLSPTSLQRSDMFDRAQVRLAWQQHQSGTANRHQQLWCVLMYQAWHRHWHPS